MDEVLAYLKEQPIVKEEAKEIILLNHVLHAWFLTAERIDDLSPERMMSPQTKSALRWAVGLLKQSDYAEQIKNSREWMKNYEQYLNYGIYDN